MPLISFIPKKYAEGFRKIATLEPKTFSSIQEGITYTSLVSTLNKLAEKVAKIKNLDVDEIREVFFSIGSLVPLLEKESSVKEITDDLVYLALKAKLIQADQESILKDRVTSLLNYQQIYYAAKGHDLLTEFGNVFIQAKIVSDIRPVFGLNIEDAPKAAMIIHNLHIHYQADIEGDHKDIYIALDSKDIKTLRDLLERAEKKEKNLQDIYKKSGIINLNE